MKTALLGEELPDPKNLIATLCMNPGDDNSINRKFFKYSSKDNKALRDTLTKKMALFGKKNFRKLCDDDFSSIKHEERITNRLIVQLRYMLAPLQEEERKDKLGRVIERLKKYSNLSRSHFLTKEILNQQKLNDVLLEIKRNEKRIMDQRLNMNLQK